MTLNFTSLALDPAVYGQGLCAAHRAPLSNGNWIVVDERQHPDFYRYEVTVFGPELAETGFGVDADPWPFAVAGTGRSYDTWAEVLDYAAKAV